MAFDTTAALALAKEMYGNVNEGLSSETAFYNLLDKKEGIGRFTEVGARGFTEVVRLSRNYKMGFRKEQLTGAGSAGGQTPVNSKIFVKYGYVPVAFTGPSLKLIDDSNKKAFMAAKAFEIESDKKDWLHHLNVILVALDRGGELGRVSAAAAGSFTADTATNLPGSLYLRKGMTIDARPAGGGAASIDSGTITNINYATHLITVPGTGTNGHVVALEDEYPASGADFPLTPEGLNSIVASSGACQNLNPATAGQEGWASYDNDEGAAQLSSQILNKLLLLTQGRGDGNVTTFLTGMAQINQLTAIATATIRFDIGNASPMGKRALDLGFTVYEYAGKPVVMDPMGRADRIFALDHTDIGKYEVVGWELANDGAGEFTRISDANGLADAIQGLGRHYLNIGVRGRANHGRSKNLQVPTPFATTPTTLV